MCPEDNNILYIMTYTLNSGIKNTVSLSPKQIDEWITIYREGLRYTTTIGSEFFGINSNLVADFKVHNKFSEQRKQIYSISDRKDEEEKLNAAYNKEMVTIRVECKCGTTYTTKEYKRQNWYCSKCKSTVYLTEKVAVGDKGIIYLMSN